MLVDPQYTIEFDDSKPRLEGNIDTGKARANSALAVVVTHAKQLLFGRRRLADGEFEWLLPGGWIEIGESPRQAA